MLFIIVTHFTWSDAQRLTYLFPFWIDMAVPILMVITGYLYAITYEKKRFDIKKAYFWREIAAKLLRYIIPVIPIVLAELVFSFLGIKTLTLKIIMAAEIGPGGYYIPVMIQIVFLLPALCALMKRNPFIALSLGFVGNVGYEILKTALGMSGTIYRIIAIRYLFVLLYGCFIYYGLSSHNLKTKKKWVPLILSGIIGALYIFLFCYHDTKPVITSLWTTTSVFAVLYIVPMMALALRPNKIKMKILEMLGKASYNIFLIQMIYYCIFAEYIYKFVSGSSLRLIISIALCTFVGVAYYYIENRFTNIIVFKVRYNS